MYRQCKKIAVMAFIWLVIALPMVGQAKLLAPDKYPEGTCELAAKEFQKAYGGDLVFVLPQKDNVWVTGEYVGAWMNRIYSEGDKKYYYINYPDKRIFSSMEQITEEYSYFDGDGYIKYVPFVYGEDNIPVGVKWHY